MFLLPEDFVGLPEPLNIRTHRMFVANAVTAMTNGINGRALGGDTDATDAVH